MRPIALRLFLICAGMLCAAMLRAQTSVVELRSDDDGAPLVRATVRFTCLDGACADSTIIRLTGNGGEATNPFAARARVVISYVGYATLRDTLPVGTRRSYRLHPASMPAVVVTGQYTPRSSELSVYDVKVFDRARIEAEAAPTLRELLAPELNVRLGEDHILGTSLGIQGMSGQNVKILIDGIPVQGRLNGNIDLSQISLANAERVEMIQGPLSVMYGTDALGGVINIITDRRARDGISGTLNGYGESVGSANTDGMLRFRSGTTSATLSGGRNFFGGYSRADTSRFKEWKPREQYRGGWGLAQQLGMLRLSYDGDYFQEYILNRGEPREPYRETAFDDTYRTYRLTNSLSLKGSIDTADYLDALVAYSIYRRRKNTFYKNLVTLDEQVTSDPSDQDTSWLHTWTARGVYGSGAPGAALAWQGGVDIGIESTGGKRIEDGIKEIGDYAVFASAEYRPFSGLVLQPALRYAYNTRYPAPLIPSFNVKLDPFADLTMRLSYARGFRAPSLQELYFLFVDINHNIRGNQDLAAERSHSVDCSFDWRLHGAAGEVTISPSFFYNTIDNLITLAQVKDDLYSYVNIGHYGTIGGDLHAALHRPELDLRLGASWIGRYNQFSEEYEVASYTFAPELNGDLSYKLPLVDTRLSAFYKYTGRIPSYGLDDSGTPREEYVGAYHMLDLSAMREFLDRSVRLTLGVKNLFDVRSIEVGATAADHGQQSSGQISIGWGRTAFIAATLMLGREP